MNRIRILVGVVVVSLLLIPSAIFAQGTADIVGRVTDTSGGVLPGVNVTAENIGTKNVRTTVTSESGDYTFNLLPIGTYTVRIELQGFSTVTSKAVLNTGDRIRVDARMQVGNISESLTVTGESPLLQTDTATLSTLVTEKSVQDLPVQGRNIMRLVQLVPGGHEGVLSSLADGTRPDDRRQTSSVSINGVGDVLNNQMVDGMDNNERAIGSIGIKPSIDATAEVRVQTNTYSAETGRTMGGIINIITKSGSNEFNGSAFEFYRNDAFDSKNYFARVNNQDKPELTQNQFGGSIGGPIKSNRTFFFGDYEVLRLDQGITNVITVPTAKMRNGDFSELSQQIYDATTTPRTPFAGNIIPKERWDPVAAQLINLYPLPNGSGIANNFTGNNLREQDHQTMDARVDHRFNDNNTVFARYSFNLVDTITPDFCPQVTDKGQTFHPVCVADTSEQGQFPGPNHTTAHNATMSWVRVINPTLISEAKGSYSRPDIYSTSFNEGLALGDLYGIPNANVPGELALHTSGMPAMLPAGYARMGDPQWVPLLTRDNSFHFAGSVTKTAGAHNLKVGGGVILREFSVLQSNSPKGLYNFSAAPTNSGGIAGVPAGGDGMASFLLGYPNSYQRRLTPLEPYYHSNEPSFYVQDDWRARSWLTVNLGIRYDVYTPFTEEENRLSNFVPSQDKILVAGENGVNSTAGVNTDYSNIQPRLGFSASLPARIVVRGGYGMSFFPNNKNSPSYLKNPPNDFTFGPVNSNAASNAAPTVFLKNGLPAVAPISPSDPRGAVIGTGDRLPVGPRAAVQPDGREGVLVERHHGRLRRPPRRPAAAAAQLQPGASWNHERRPAPTVPRERKHLVPEHVERDRAGKPGRIEVQRDAADLPAPLHRGAVVQHALHIRARHADDTGAVGHDDPRVGRRGARHASPLRAAGELRAAVGQRPHRPLARGPVRLAAQRRGVLADRIGLHRHQQLAADQHRRQRPAEPDRRPGTAGKREDARSLVQHQRVRAAACGHRGQRRFVAPPRPVAAAGRLLALQGSADRLQPAADSLRALQRVQHGQLHQPGQQLRRHRVRLDREHREVDPPADAVRRQVPVLIGSLTRARGFVPGPGSLVPRVVSRPPEVFLLSFPSRKTSRTSAAAM